MSEITFNTQITVQYRTEEKSISRQVQLSIDQENFNFLDLRNQVCASLNWYPITWETSLSPPAVDQTGGEKVYGNWIFSICDHQGDPIIVTSDQDVYCLIQELAIRKKNLIISITESRPTPPVKGNGLIIWDYKTVPMKKDYTTNTNVKVLLVEMGKYCSNFECKVLHSNHLIAPPGFVSEDVTRLNELKSFKGFELIQSENFHVTIRQILQSVSKFSVIIVITNNHEYHLLFDSFQKEGSQNWILFHQTSVNLSFASIWKVAVPFDNLFTSIIPDRMVKLSLQTSSPSPSPKAAVPDIQSPGWSPRSSQAVSPLPFGGGPLLRSSSCSPTSSGLSSPREADIWKSYGMRSVATQTDTKEQVRILCINFIRGMCSNPECSFVHAILPPEFTLIPSSYPLSGRMSAPPREVWGRVVPPTFEGSRDASLQRPIAQWTGPPVPFNIEQVGPPISFGQVPPPAFGGDRRSPFGGGREAPHHFKITGRTPLYEFQGVHQEPKCKYFQLGQCQYGTNCKFPH